MASISVSKTLDFSSNLNAPARKPVIIPMAGFLFSCYHFRTMKKIFLMIGAVVLLGAGCNQVPPVPSTTETPVESETSESATTSQEQPPKDVASDDLPESPPVAETSEAVVVDETWIKTTTRSGVTLTYPVKGAFAPQWTYTRLASDDARLQGDCYVTDAVVSKRTEVAGHEQACQTTTALDAGPGTRTDYFVFRSGEGSTATIHLFTFTKEYKAGFDMDKYGAVLAKVIEIIS